MSERRRKRIWVQNVAVGVRSLQTRLDIAAARGLTPEQQAAAEGIRAFLDRASNAAYRVDPMPGRLSNWWQGTLVDGAFQNLHAASAQMVDLYEPDELLAEIPRAVARAEVTLHRDDPRRVGTAELAALPLDRQRAVLRRTIEDGYAASDRQHERVRGFRNIVLGSAILIGILVTITIAAVATNPTVMPFCFPASGQPVESTAAVLVNCPTGTNVRGPDNWDVAIVALLGLLGGSLAAAVSIRNLRGTSNPYDVPVALAMLKVPLGAFTAIVGLVAIQGDFVPGLSALDSQEQILAYALILGFAQQVFTRLLDKRAQSLLDALPAKDPEAPTTPSSPPPPAAIPAPGTGPAELGAANGGGTDVTLAQADFQPNPEGDDDGQVQDDGSDVLDDVPVKEHR